jgi:hypothetical protein
MILIYLSKLMTDAVSSLGKTPFDVKMGTSDTAGAAFQTPFVSYRDTVFFQAVDICRTKIKAGLIGAFIPADRPVDDPQVRVLIHPETVQK